MESFKRFDEKYLAVIHAIQDNFAQNLNRQIHNDVARTRSDRSSPLQFNDVGFNNERTNFLLSNIKMMSPVELHAPEIGVDLLNESIRCAFEARDVRIDADYCSITQGMFNLRVTQHGKLNFVLKGVRLSGLIGMFTREDSFMPVNYDIKYDMKEIDTKTTSYTPTGQPCEHNCFNVKHNVDHCVSTDINSTLLSLIWVDVQKAVDTYLQRLIAGNVVEYSFSELFLDEPDEYKFYEGDRVSMSNETVDDKLREFKIEFTTGALLASSQPALCVSFTVGNEVYNLTTTSCRLDRLDTLVRITDASFYEDEDQKTFYAYVALSEFEFVLDNCVISSPHKEDIKGSIRLSPDRNKFFLKLQSSKKTPERHCRAFLDVISLDGVFVAEKNLNDHDNHAFTYVIEKLLPYMLGYVRFHTNVILQKYVKRFNEHCYELY